MLLSTTALASAAILSAGASPSHAQTAWNGTTSNNWFIGGNWTPGVPTAADATTIDTVAPNPTVIDGAAAVSGTLGIGTGIGTTGNLTIRNNGTLTSQSPVTVGGSGTGTLTVGTGGALTVSGGTRTINIASAAGSTGTLNIGTAIANPAVAPGNIDALNIQFGAGTGSLNFNHTGTTYQFAPTISGNGTVRFQAGTTVLTSDSTAFTGTTTIASGATMQLGPNLVGFGAGISTGSLSGAITNNGAILINRGGTVTFDSVISGSGTFTQIDPVPGPFSISVTSVMNAVNTYTGATVINRGALLMNGSNTASTTTNNGGLLAGTGTFGNTINNFEISPGGVNGSAGIVGSIGTLNVAGNLTLNSGSRYFADISPATADRIAVTGNMLLDGRLVARPSNGTYTPGQYALLTSAGRAGTFSAFVADGNFSGLQASLNYVGTSVFLNLATFVGGTDSQWLASPGTNVFNTASNWTPASTPTGTATFDASNTTTLSFGSGTTYIGGFKFNAGAPAYTFNVDGTVFRNLNFMTTGIVNNSASRPTFFLVAAGFPQDGGATINFMNGSTAGNAQFEVVSFASGRAPLRFFDTSSAATAIINNNFGEGTAFYNSTTAANATINNGSDPSGLSGGTAFYDNSTAANATINNPANIGGVTFFNNSTAGNALINNAASVNFSFGQQAKNFAGVNFADSSNAGTATILNAGGSTDFYDNASAANATFVNSNAPLFYSLEFSDNSTAASANITNNDKGITIFQSSATAANATIVNNSGGSTQFYNTASGGNALITNNSGGRTEFHGKAQAPNGTIVNNAGGVVDIGEDPMEAAFLVSPSVSIGSISGAGNVFLGARNLSVGNLNLNDTIGGVIAEGGQYPDAIGGSLTKVGTGTLTLTGNNTYTGATTISSGVLQLGNGGASGAVAGDVAIAGGAALVINRSGTLSLPGNFSGTGTLTQNGSVTTTLGGNGTAFTGPTTINGGTMLVNGNFGNSPFTVNSGATLGGNGTAGNTTINGGATLSPGNSIGTLNINGNLVLGAGSIYRVEVSPTTADRTNVTGTAQLGGTAQLVFGPGAYTSNSYTILSAAGGRSGTFDAVTTNGLPPALSASLTYTSNDVLLVTLLSSITSLPVSFTPNQRAVAAAQDGAFNAGLSAIPALYNLPLSQLPGALDQLSGEVHVSTAGVLLDESRYPRDAVLGRLRQASYGGNTQMAALTTGGPQAIAADGSELTSALAYAKSPIVTKAPPMVAPTYDVTFWAQGFGAWGRFETDGNAATVRRDLAGFISGVDTRVGGNGRLGVAAGYSSSKNALDARGVANVDTGHVAGYGGWNFGAWNLRAGGSYSFHTIDTDRTIAFPGFFDRATAHYDGHTGQVFGELGYGMALGSVAVEPFAGAAWVSVKTDAAAERGGLAALNFAGTTLETGYSTLGIRAAGMVPLSPDMILIPRGSLAWQHAFDNVTPLGTLAFQAAPVPFVIAGVPIARDALLAEAGLDLAIGRNATLGVSYTGQVARTVQDHGAKGKFSWRF